MPRALWTRSASPYSWPDRPLFVLFLQLSIYLSFFFLLLPFYPTFFLSALSLFLSYPSAVPSSLFLFLSLSIYSSLSPSAPFHFPSHLSLPRPFHLFQSSILPCLFTPCSFRLLFLSLSLSIFLSIYPSAMSSLFLSVNWSILCLFEVFFPFPSLSKFLFVFPLDYVILFFSGPSIYPSAFSSSHFSLPTRSLSFSWHFHRLCSSRCTANRADAKAWCNPTSKSRIFFRPENYAGSRFQAGRDEIFCRVFPRPSFPHFRSHFSFFFPILSFLRTL